MSPDYKRNNGQRYAPLLGILAQAFEHSELAQAISDLRTNLIIAANSAFALQHGYTIDELIGQPVMSMFAPDRLPEVRKRLKHLDSTSHGIFESEHVRKDGSSFPVLIDVTIIHDAEGIPINRVAYVFDNSERKRTEEQLQVALKEQQQARIAALNLMEAARAARRQAEEAAASLRQSEANYRLLADNAADCIFWLGADGRYRYISPACAQISGYTPEELIADPELSFRMIHPDDRAAFREHLVRDRSGDDTEMEFRIMRKDGSLRWLGHHCQPIYSGTGEYLGRSGANRDITERKLAEEQLLKLSLAVEQSPESIVITDLAARIEYVNDAFVQATGYGREEVIGQNPRMLHSGKTRGDTYATLWATLLRGGTWKGEFINRRKNGEEYIEFAIITPLRSPDGSTTHYVAIKEDITEKRRIGHELDQHRHHLEQLVVERTRQLDEARVRAEAANRTKSSFLANMSHEIRTPLNAIIGLTHLMRRSELPADQTERLDKIDGAGQHLLAIINDILDLSKIEAGRLELERVDFALESVLDNVASIMTEPARAKALPLHLDYDEVPRWLHGDPTRLRQALLNYVSNAIKFTEKGRIDLRVRLQERAGDDVLIRFEVEDTGIGLELEKIGNLFQAFEQADASTSRRFGGTGLGLVVTRRLAELMGGETGVTSTLGAGSTFWFTARLGVGQGMKPASDPLRTLDGERELRRRAGGARLLLVEDNVINREVALELLHAVGLNVDQAEDGEAALAKVRSRSYDLVLMDLQMPKMDGVTATREIRALNDYRDTPIIAMTANAFMGDRQTCEAAGMNDFVTKPVEPELLYATLLKWLPARALDKPANIPANLAEPPVADAASSALVEQLALLPGLDIARGLRAVRGKRGVYLSLLRQLVEGHRDDPGQMRRHLASGAREEARRLAHGLKGVSGTLGVNAIAQSATRIDALLREPGAPIDTRILERLIDEIAAALATLSALLTQAVALTKPPVTVDPEAFRSILNTLERLLVTGDIAAQTHFDRHATEFEVVLGKDAGGRLARAVQAFQFETAQTLLREWCRTASADFKK